jgi:hypothetical protein
LIPKLTTLGGLSRIRAGSLGAGAVILRDTEAVAPPVPSGLGLWSHQQEGVRFAINRLRTSRGAMFGGERLPAADVWDVDQIRAIPFAHTHSVMSNFRTEGAQGCTRSRHTLLRSEPTRPALAMSGPLACAALSWSDQRCGP